MNKNLLAPAQPPATSHATSEASTETSLQRRYPLWTQQWLLDKEDWDAAYRTEMRINYDKALTASSDNDDSISTGLGNLATMAKQIKKTATVLRFVLLGNYPDIYKSVYRDWADRKRIIKVRG